MARVLWLKILFRNLFILLLFYIGCSSQTILDIDELSVQYGIEITNKPVILNSQPMYENILQLSSKHGQPYSCFLPKLAQVDEQEPSRGTIVENVTDILDKSLNGTCTTHKKGWWTYKLCHKKSITQYHVAEIGDVLGPTTTLGVFASEDDWTKEEVLERKPSEIFHSHQYVNGSMCDVTQKRRKTTVQYFCAAKPTDSIIRIEEPATCEYIITMHSTKLCAHSLFFKKEKRTQINLVCSPALMQHDYNKYMDKLNEKKAAEETKKLEMLTKMKKKEFEEAGKGKGKEKHDGLTNNVLAKEDSTAKVDFPQSKGKKNEKLKNTMKDISSFMKGFMKVLNIKSDDVKFTTKLVKDVMEGKRTKEDIIIDDLKSAEVQDEALMKDSLNLKLNGNLDKTEDMDPDINKGIKYITDAIGDIHEGTTSKDIADNILKEFDVENTAILPEHQINGGKPGTLKTLNDITGTMIKQLEEDSEKMQRQASKERQTMHNEFDRVRKNAVEELGKSQDILHVLETLNKDARNDKSRKDIAKEINSVRTLVDRLHWQIRTIDDKRKLVDELEIDTNKRLQDINKKILNTKTAHKFAKTFESMATEHNAENDFNQIIRNVFKKTKEHVERKDKKQLLAEKSDVEDEDEVEEEEEEEKLQEKGDYKTLSKDMDLRPDDKQSTPIPTTPTKKSHSKDIDVRPDDKQSTPIPTTPSKKSHSKDIDVRPDDKPSTPIPTTPSKKSHTKDIDVRPDDKQGTTTTTTTTNKNSHSTMVKNIVSNLKEQVGKLKQHIKEFKLIKGETSNEDTKGEPTLQSIINDKNGGALTKEEVASTKSELNDLVDVLKQEMGKINEKIKKEKNKLSPAARYTDTNEKAIVEESEKAVKNKMEVRIRTIDEASFKETDKETDKNINEEMKEATKKMEETVRKQLKDAGLDFSDNIKIKIITTKEKFEKFSKGKDVKLLSDDDASDFKDLLLGFLGGGNEKVSEEKRQKTLEDNYNFVLDEEEEKKEDQS